MPSPPVCIASSQISPFGRGGYYSHYLDQNNSRHWLHISMRVSKLYIICSSRSIWFANNESSHSSSLGKQGLYFSKLLFLRLIFKYNPQLLDSKSYRSYKARSSRLILFFSLDIRLLLWRVCDEKIVMSLVHF